MLGRLIIKLIRLLIIASMDEGSVEVKVGRVVIWTGHVRSIKLERDLRYGNRGRIEIDFNDVVEDLEGQVD